MSVLIDNVETTHHSLFAYGIKAVHVNSYLNCCRTYYEKCALCKISLYNWKNENRYDIIEKILTH